MSKTELYKKYRPTKLKNVVGQVAAVDQIETFLKDDSVPHTILFTGPSGCGKTTLARILVKELKCGKVDFIEHNAAKMRGIDDIRSIENRMHASPIDGDCRIWLIDECHQLTGAAQDSFLKALEDTPEHVYFFLATTDPQKLKKTIKTRCTEVKVQEMSYCAMQLMIKHVTKKEDIKLRSETTEKIISIAQGSARKGLVLLNSIMGVKLLKKQIAVLDSGDTEAKAIEVARLLMNKKTQWPEMGKLLKDLKAGGEDPEGIRRMILGYMASVTLNSQQQGQRCSDIFETFRDNYYDTNFSGLVFNCFEIVGKK